MMESLFVLLLSMLSCFMSRFLLSDKQTNSLFVLSKRFIMKSDNKSEHASHHVVIKMEFPFNKGSCR
jgi:hypothetical protein